MSFYVEPALDLIAEKMEQNPAFQDRFEAIKELRSSEAPLYQGSEWKRVANLQGPLLDLAMVLDPEWLQNKRRFYAFLDQHPAYCTYDRRKDPIANQITFSEGKVIV